MDLGLKGKKVIITGGSHGIGRAALELFAAEGAQVGFVSRREESVTNTIEAIRPLGANIVGRAFDLTSRDGYAEVLEDIAASLGGCDIFVPCASASGMQATGDWQTCLDIDIMGTVKGCEALERHLEASDQAAVIIMASTAATETFLVPQAFNAIKAALLTYSGQLAQSWGSKQIRVNAISPGPVEFAGGNWAAIKEAIPDLYHSQTFALGRIGTPEDIARTIVFLASPMSGYTTGTNIVIDGGYTKRIQF